MGIYCGISPGLHQLYYDPTPELTPRCCDDDMIRVENMWVCVWCSHVKEAEPQLAPIRVTREDGKKKS